MAKTKQQGFWAATKEIIVLLLIVFIIRTFGFGLYQVPTGSMETTMLRGERFFADKLTVFFTTFKHGDVIVMNNPTFNYSKNSFLKLYQEYVGFPLLPSFILQPDGWSWGPENWTKRVIGVPGDTVRGVVENSKPVVYLNGKKLDEPYTNKYPLIALWRDRSFAGVPWDRLLEDVRRSSVEEAWRMGASFAEDASNVKILQREIFEGYLWEIKSYDPSYSFENQPYYRMSEYEVVRVPKGYSHEGITVTDDGLVLKEPGTPLAKGSPLPYYSSKKDRRWNYTDEFYVELGSDEYWCMGDNRRGSWDSRAFGVVKGEHIHGKVLFRIWSIDTDESWWILDLVKHPIDFWKRVRWSRIFDRVK